MNNKKTSSWNLGVKGYIVVILAFFSCYVYSALTSDSLNVTRDIFIGLGINASAVYAMSTIAVPFGIVGSIILGRLIQKHSIRLYWGLSMIITAVFTVAIGRMHNTIGVVVCYVVIYTFSLASAMLLAGEIIGHWFPTKRCSHGSVYSRLSVICSYNICSSRYVRRNSWIFHVLCGNRSYRSYRWYRSNPFRS